MIFFYAFLILISIKIVFSKLSSIRDSDKTELVSNDTGFSVAVCSDQDRLAFKSILELSPIFQKFDLVKDENIPNILTIEKEGIYFAVSLETDEDVDYDEEYSTINCFFIDFECDDKEELSRLVKKAFSLADEVGWKVYDSDYKITTVLNEKDVLKKALLALNPAKLH